MPTALPPIHATPTAQIYCHMCGSIQPLVIDDPQPGPRGPFDNATDLVCGTCQFVVTTTYTLRPQRKGSNRPHPIDVLEASPSAAGLPEASGGAERYVVDAEADKRCA